MRMSRSESGVLTLEASICLTLFIFLMLFIYSFFVVFEARNVMAHAVLSTTDSLALDVYRTDKLQGSDDMAAFFDTLFHAALPNDSPFVTNTKWYTLNEYSSDWNNNIYAGEGSGDDENYLDEYGNKAYVSSAFAEVVKTRFFAYLAGSDQKDDIENVLNRYHVVGGMEGIDFSKSRIIGDKLFIVISYQLDYEYDVMNLLGIQFEQSACSKLWK